jgi:hypothetical protein
LAGLGATDPEGIGTEWAELDSSSDYEGGDETVYINWHTGASVDIGEDEIQPNVNLDSPTFSVRPSCSRLIPNQFVSWQTSTLALMDDTSGRSNGAGFPDDTLYVENCRSGHRTVVGHSTIYVAGAGRWIVWEGDGVVLHDWYDAFDLRGRRHFRVTLPPSEQDKDPDFIVGNRIYVDGYPDYWAEIPPTI